MRTSIVTAATLLVGASATGVGALTLPNPMYGSDTLQFVTTDSISGDSQLGPSLTGVYKAGGSGAGQGAMANQTSAASAPQSAAPMSKMMTNGNSLCTAYGGTLGSAALNASGVSVGMDAVDVYSSIAAGGAAVCNGTADGTGFGLAYSGVPTGVFANGNTGQNWKWALALLYGGLDLSAANGGTADNPDCNSAARKALVANWSNLFQVGAACTNGDASICNAAAGTGFAGALGHAFRRDDASGTSDVFSSLIGLQINMPSPSASSNNGFGASPYCNALNWDTNTSNNGGGFCALGIHDQFVGPGGVIDPASTCVFTDFKSADLKVTETCSTTGNHRMPPTGVWGSAQYVCPTGVTGCESNSSSVASAWDVLPTSFQDNDPIRRTCLGNSTASVFKSGEEVCNVDGQLGVVLSIPASDFISTSLTLVQYPTLKCTGSFFGAKPPQTLNCAPFATGKHNGECPNGDSAFANSCFSPVDTTDNTSQCLNGKTQFAIIQNRTLGSYDGRRHNLAMMDGDMNNGTMKYIEDTVQNGSATPPIVDFFGGMGRIHTYQTVFDVTLNGGNPTNIACQMTDATDQIACLTQADPCSVGYAGDGGKTWNERGNGVVCANLVAAGLCTGGPPYAGANCPTACVSQGTSTATPTLVSDSIRIDQIYPTSTTVLALGSQTASVPEYQVGRKLYYNSLVGFPSLVNTTAGWADQAVQGELSLGEYEANGANMTTILPSVGYFPYSSSTQAAPYNAPFCEDFNEPLICANPESGGTWTNNNACTNTTTGNPTIPAPTVAGLAAIPITGSVCGNGIKEAYEECDNGTPGVTSGPGTGVGGGTIPGNGASGNNCSTICRCSGTTSYEPTGGSPPFACQ
jgi:hypothetical protein